MEKKIVFTSVEPNKNLLWLHYKNGLLVLQRFGSNGWEDISNSDHITSEKVEELLENKADLVGGKVPAEQLPSYVDDVVRYGVSQNLTDTHKQQARTNIGVQSADELLEDADFIAQLKTKLETV